VAFFTAGSGGTNGDNLRYIRHLATQGYSVIAPDTMSAPAGSAYPRRKALVPSLATSLAGRPQSYWCKDEDYCSPFRIEASHLKVRRLQKLGKNVHT
jgi:dienelactone hydrolase